MKKFFSLILVLLLILFFGKGFAKSVTVTSNTNWSSISVGSGDNVTVKGGATLTINVSNAVCSNIVLGADPGGTGTLKFNSGSVLTLTYTGNSLTLGSGSKSGSLDMSLGGTLNLSGTINDVNLGSFTEGAGTIVYNRSGNQTVYSTTYNNLQLAGSGTKTLSSGITINGTMTVGGSVSLAGTAPSYGSSSELLYNGSSTQTTTQYEFPSLNGPKNVTIDNTSGVSFPSSFSRTISGTLNLTNGTLTIGANTLTLNGSVNVASGSLYGDSTSSSIVIGGSGANSVLAVQGGLKNLTINRTDGITLGSDLTINGLLTLTTGLFKTTSSHGIYFTTAATNPSETTNGYIVGTAVMKRRSVGTGILDFLNANIQGSVNIGYVTITRKTGADGILTSNGNSGIAANWDINTSVVMSGTRGVTFRWLPAFDNNIVFSTGTLAQLYRNNSGLFSPIGNPANVSGSSLRSVTVSVTDFGQYTVGASDSPLPVTLSSFTSVVNGRNVKLNWITQKETNNSGFEIQKMDLNSQSSNYKVIGFVNGKGNSDKTVNYTFEDSKLAAGKYKYRLRQVDFNGNYEYFELNGYVEVGVPGKFTLSQNYPNPFNPMTKIDFSVPSDSRVNIKVYDASGKEVETLVNENKIAGYYTVTFNASGLSSGMYFCRMIANSQDNNFTSTQKMILVK